MSKVEYGAKENRKHRMYAAARGSSKHAAQAQYKNSNAAAGSQPAGGGFSTAEKIDKDGSPGKQLPATATRLPCCR